MNSQNIATLLQLPDKSKVDCVQGLVTEVYKQRTVLGDKVVQDALIKDATGEIKFSVWGHPDIVCYKGREVIIQSGAKGAVVIKLDTYKQPNVNSLSVSSTCTFQYLEVHSAQSGGQKPVASSSTPSAGLPAAPAPKYSADPKAEGQRLGMCFKLAGDFYLNVKLPDGQVLEEDLFVAKTKALTVKLVKASKELETETAS